MQEQNTNVSWHLQPNIPKFEFSYKPVKKQESFENVVSDLRRVGFNARADQLEKYLLHRQHFLDTHYGKYVYITDDDIIKFDDIDSLNHEKNKKGGHDLRVGYEGDADQTCYHCHISGY